MTLNEKVAQLSAGPDTKPAHSKGSAWFIDKQHALTALHCVRGIAGQYNNIALKISGVPQAIAAKILDVEEKLDVALLQITATTLTTTIPILSLARHTGLRDDKVLMHGHPAQSLIASPNGVSVGGKINDPLHHFNGGTGGLDCEVIQCYDISVPASNGSSGLKGISGGPVILDRNNTDVAVIGLVIEDGMSGGYIHVIPIAAIAARFSQVQVALENSTHVNTDDNRICIALAKDGTSLEWAASVSPDDIGRLWCEPQQNKYELHLSAKLSDLDQAAQALTRLAMYSGVKSIHSPDGDEWTKRLNSTRHLALHPIAGLGTLPAQGQNHTTEALANTIHAALNNKILNFLNDQLFACLDNNEDCDIGCVIEQKLRKEMWKTWKDWKRSLSGNAALLASFLVRVFNLDGAASIDHDALLTIIPSSKIKKQLLHATIYVLAIAAAGISAQPQEHQLGNFAVNQKTGHTSGVEFHERKRISMVAADHNWKTDVIFLPFLQTQLLAGVSKAVALTKPDGTVGCHQKNNFPIAITAHNDFLIALEQGKTAVLAYYNARVAEVKQQQNEMESPTRTEALNA
jgi:hypothetical protein